MKKYLKCTVTNYLGTVFNNPLKISEAYLITSILKENKIISIQIINCSKEEYKQLFG